MNVIIFITGGFPMQPRPFNNVTQMLLDEKENRAIAHFILQSIDATVRLNRRAARPRFLSFFMPVVAFASYLKVCFCVVS